MSSIVLIGLMLVQSAMRAPPTDISSVFPHQTEASARAALAPLGLSVDQKVDDGSVNIIAGSIRINICKGTVTTVTRVLGHKFEDFANFATQASEAMGRPEVDTGHERFGPGDSGSAVFSLVRLTWLPSNYQIAYIEWGSGHEAYEALMGDIKPGSASQCSRL